MADGLTCAPAISVVMYSFPTLEREPNWPPAVAGPTNLRVGSTASIFGVTAFHIVRYWEGVSAWPLAGAHGVSLVRSGSFHGSQCVIRLRVPAGLRRTVPLSVVIDPLL